MSPQKAAVSVDITSTLPFTSLSCLQLVQQWPQIQKSATKDVEEDDDDDNTGGINLDKAKERLQEEDKFDKEEYRKKIKAKHRVSFLLGITAVFLQICQTSNSLEVH